MSAVQPVIGYLEDDPVIRENYIDLLESDGYSVVSFDNRKDASNSFLDGEIDLALLDVELGNDSFGGMELCKELRKAHPDIPIIFLTSHSHIDMQSRGWRLGADDYVTKDTALELVLLRIRALLKRYSVLRNEFEHAANDCKKNGLSIDDKCYKAYWNSEQLDLSLTQFWLLTALAKSEGKAVNHDELQTAAKIYVEPNTIVAHIKSIREEFKKISPSFSSIKTERGRGYRWVD